MSLFQKASRATRKTKRLPSRQIAQMHHIYTVFHANMPTCQKRLSRQRNWAVASRTSAICKKQRIVPRAHPALEPATAHRVRVAVGSHVAKRQDIRSVVALPSTARRSWLRRAVRGVRIKDRTRPEGSEKDEEMNARTRTSEIGTACCCGE